MNRRIWFAFFLLLITGCISSSDGTLVGTPAAPLSLAATQAPKLALPDPKIVARIYLDAWKAEDYVTMYTWLSPLSQDAIDEIDFVALHRDLAATMDLSQVGYEILSSLTQARTGQVAYRVMLETTLLGEIQRDTVMNLTLERDQWRIKWDRGMILPELSGGNSLLVDYRAPARGNIYDRNGGALVAQAEAVSLGIIVGDTDPSEEEFLFNELWLLTGLRPSYIRGKLEVSREGWYVPLAEASADLVAARFDVLSGFRGLVIEPYRARYYFDGGIASQLIGYVSLIQPEELEAYSRLGYQQDERVGQMGLEKWAEPFLSGRRGGELYVITPEGDVVTKLAEVEPEPAQSIYTTLDKELQNQAQDALEGFVGAVVVMERDSGRIVAMVSSPGFDPNLFEPSNYNSGFLLEDLLNDPSTPILNRATQGQYPLGSVFKIITLATALESNLYTAGSTYYCGHTFTELPGTTRYDWTYAWEAPASGLLTLPEGLMRSCNPYFWHIGLDLYNQGLDTAISDMALGFGLGNPIGIEQVVEEIGQAPVPQNPVEAINLAIGQGDTLVTPIQVVNFVAAIGNGGNLLRPQIVERIESQDGTATYTFEPEVLNRLPIREDNLAVLRSAMESVVNNPRGTAYWRFINFPIPIAGKTGTAEVPSGDPHAWFTGYTYAGRPDKPEIAAVVVLENAGEGSVVAAPIFKRIVEIYYFGQPLSPLPWESDVEITPPSDSGTP